MFQPRPDTRFSSSFPKQDPFHVTDLAGYLSFAGILGGVVLYGAALGVQFKLPEIFPSFYVFLVAVIAAPFAYVFLLA